MTVSGLYRTESALYLCANNQSGIEYVSGMYRKEVSHIQLRTSSPSAKIGVFRGGAATPGGHSGGKKRR